MEPLASTYCYILYEEAPDKTKMSNLRSRIRSFSSAALTKTGRGENYQRLSEKKVLPLNADTRSALPFDTVPAYYELVIPDPLRPIWKEELAHLAIHITKKLPRHNDCEVDRYLCFLTPHQALLAYHLTFVNDVILASVD